MLFIFRFLGQNCEDRVKSYRKFWASIASVELTSFYIHFETSSCLVVVHSFYFVSGLVAFHNLVSHAHSRSRKHQPTQITLINEDIYSCVFLCFTLNFFFLDPEEYCGCCCCFADKSKLPKNGSWTNETEKQIPYTHIDTNLYALLII